jgi:hypothetical protein
METLINSKIILVVCFHVAVIIPLDTILAMDDLFIRCSSTVAIVIFTSFDKMLN